MSKSPRIALYITGHMRTWSDKYQQILQWWIKGYNVDVFIATYWTLDRSDPINDEYKDEKYILTEDEIKKAFSGLPVKGLQIDADNLEPPIVLNNNRTHTWRTWRKVQQCNEMRKSYEQKENFQYDYCIRTRPDIIIMEKLCFEYLPPLDKFVIGAFGATLGWPDDLFVLTSRIVMDHYANLDKFLIPISGPHHVVSLTFAIYPVTYWLQTAMVRKIRDRDMPDEYRIYIKFDNGYISYFNKQVFGRGKINIEAFMPLIQ